MKRIMIGGMMHESNTFNPIPTDLEAFRIRDILYGSEMIRERRNTNTEIGGFIDGLDSEGIEIVPSIVSFAMPSGLVTEDAFDEFLRVMLDTLDSGNIDGVLLCLHGAMAGYEHDDGDGYILERIRDKVGPEIPVVISLDFHVNLTPLMASTVNAMTLYRTYPHMDMAERGREAATILMRILNGELHPVVAISKQPLMIGPPHNVLPHEMPMKLIMDRAREMERKIPGVIAACPGHGFMQQDMPYTGAGVAVTTDNDLELAQKCADELGDMMFSHRNEYIVELPGPEETIRLAMKSDNYPVAIADSGDNIGGGTPGDGTILLHEILKQGVDTAFVPLWDHEAAKIAAEKGVGAAITLKSAGNPIRFMDLRYR